MTNVDYCESRPEEARSSSGPASLLAMRSSSAWISPAAPSGGYPRLKGLLFKRFALGGQRVELLRADSHDPRTLERVRSLLRGRSVDFLFIDGDHSYEGVKRDYEMYSGLVKEGGIIAFHDIVRHPPETGCEVHRFWNEIKNRYKYIEIVRDWGQGWAGIGVLYV